MSSSTSKQVVEAGAWGTRTAFCSASLSQSVGKGYSELILLVIKGKRSSVLRFPLDSILCYVTLFVSGSMSQSVSTEISEHTAPGCYRHVRTSMSVSRSQRQGKISAMPL